MKTYNSNPLLKATNVQLEFTEDQILEYAKCANDPIYFIKNYCKIISLDRGLINFELFDYQIRFILSMHNNNKVISLQPRQMGKTITVAAYILYYTLFNDDKTVAILANKGSAAREILSRYQLMYEQLPPWLQLGVATWNKGDIKLENRSKVFTAATSGSGIRGKSCVTDDTKVCLNINNNIHYLPIKEILEYKSITNNIKVKFKTIFSALGDTYIEEYITNKNNIIKDKYIFKDGYLGNSKQINHDIELFGPELFYQEIISVEDIDSLDGIDNYYDNATILTQDGFKQFQGFINQGMSTELYQIKITGSKSIKATADHMFLGLNDNWIEVKDLKVNDILFGGVIESIELIDNQIVYDAYEVEDVHHYYSNGFVSHNCNFLYVDEAAFIPNTIADEFFTSTYPTISSGKSTKIVLTSTPLGYNHFWHFWNQAENKINGFTPVEVKWSENPTRDEKWAEDQRALLGDLKFTQEVLCSFLGSSATLISAAVYSKMKPKQYIYNDNTGLNILEMPIQGHTYILIADTSKGVGGDYSAFTVIDITTVPYKVVAKYKNNVISPLLYPNIIDNIGKKYNQAYVLLEINSSEQVAYILNTELEYENILTIARTPKSGQVVSGGFSGGNRTFYGVSTDKRVKRIGCTILKSLIEENKIIIEDVDIINEISTFIEKNGSYAADDGYHDDLIMTLVLFAWLTRDPFFESLNDVNIRQLMYMQRIQQMEEELAPIGWYDNGLSSNIEKPYLNF